MEMKKTEKGTKKFTNKEKLAILKEAKENGVKVTLEKYDLYPATYYYWKKKIEREGSIDSLNGMSKANRLELKKLKKENHDLKILLAEKELESKLKDELLKKKYPNLKK